MSAQVRKGHQDPMSADRRTLTIGAIAMVVLIAVGVVSASVFARGGCVAAPESATPTAQARGDVGAALGDHLGVAGDELVAAIESATGRTATSATTVADATGLVVTDGGIVAAGGHSTLIGGDGEPLAALDVGGDVQLLGGGPTSYAIGFVNPDTGQASAITPVDGGDLAIGDCLDTALVGELFAFHLDARDGQLLLLRTDDDADNTEIELRDARRGQIWSTPLELGFGSPGIVADRTSAALTEDAVVIARRTAVDDGLPALLVLDRSDGEVLLARSAEELARDTAVPADQPLRWQVVAADDQVAHLAVTVDADDPEPPVLVRVAVDDGVALGDASLDGPVAATALGDDGRLALLVDGHPGLLEIGPDGKVERLDGTPGSSDPLALVDDTATTVLDGALVGRGGPEPLPDEVTVLDLAIRDGQLAVLLGHADDDRDAILVLLA